MTDPLPQRRTALFTLAGTMLAVGAGASLWPIVRSMAPAADKQDGRMHVDLSKILVGGIATVAWQRLPVSIYRRTADQIAALRSGSPDPRLKDPTSDFSRQPEYAKNPLRSIRPEFLVFIRSCTHEGCIVLPPEAEACFMCPCYGCRYDLAGRALSPGSARLNLAIPPHTYSGDDIVILEPQPDFESPPVS